MIDIPRDGEYIWCPNHGPQTKFLSAAQREVLYGGANGGGKSDALLAAATRYVDEPDHTAIIFRRTYPELGELIKRSSELYHPLGGRYNITDKRWRFPSGAIVMFGNLASYSDALKYHGWQFTFLGFDELTHWPSDEEYVYLISRLRRKANSKVRLMIRATCNPSGPGHHWVKSRFSISNEGKVSIAKDSQTGLHRAFIPARIQDNPHLAGSEYERTLEALPEAKRKALKDGRWDVFAGAMFPEWDPSWLIIEPFEIPGDWERWRGADQGFVSPSACYWLARNPDRQVFVYQELYRTGMTGRVFGEEVLKRDSEQNPYQTNLSGYLDSNAFTELGTGKPIGKVMNRMGCRWRSVPKGPGSRVARVNMLHEYLAPIEGYPDKPGLLVFDTCTNLIRTLPALPRSQGNPEDVDTDAEDHAFDGLTYGLCYKRYTVTVVSLGL